MPGWRKELTWVTVSDQGRLGTIVSVSASFHAISKASSCLPEAKKDSVSEQRFMQEEVTHVHCFDVVTLSFLEMGASQGEGPGETWDN